MERTTRFEPATLTLARYADLFRRPAVLVDHWFASFRTVSRCLAACTRPEKVRVCHPCGCLEASTAPTRHEALEMPGEHVLSRPGGTSVLMDISEVVPSAFRVASHPVGFALWRIEQLGGLVPDLSRPPQGRRSRRKTHAPHRSTAGTPSGEDARSREQLGKGKRPLWHSPLAVQGRAAVEAAIRTLYLPAPA